MPVQPVQLGPVEDRRRRRYPLNLELAGQFFGSEGLARPALRAPAQQRQVIDQRLGQNAHFPKTRDRGRSVALRQPLAVAAQNRREVRELRDGPTEGLVNGYLLGSVRDVVIAANPMRDLHERVVYGDDIVVDRNARRTHENWIADRLAGKLNLAT